MREIPILDQAIVDVLHSLLKGNRRTSTWWKDSWRRRRATGAKPRWKAGDRRAIRPYGTQGTTRSSSSMNSASGKPKPPLGSGGTLVVAVVNAQYGWFLLRRLEGHDAPEAPLTDVDCVCARLENDGLGGHRCDTGDCPTRPHAIRSRPDSEDHVRVLVRASSRARDLLLSPARPALDGPTAPVQARSAAVVRWFSPPCPGRPRASGVRRTRWADELADRMRDPPGDARAQTVPLASPRRRVPNA